MFRFSHRFSSKSPIFRFMLWLKKFSDKNYRLSNFTNFCLLQNFNLESQIADQCQFVWALWNRTVWILIRKSYKNSIFFDTTFFENPPFFFETSLLTFFSTRIKQLRNPRITKRYLLNASYIRIEFNGVSDTLFSFSNI